jgi:peptidoglycan glycosyltransferase
MDTTTADTMREWMFAVVNDPRGTGGAARIPGVPVAGKTGTAETGDGRPPHAWFIAFAPADSPRYAVSVLVEHGGTDGTNAEATGGRVAAPIAKQVLEALLASAPPPSRCDRGQPGSGGDDG